MGKPTAVLLVAAVFTIKLQVALEAFFNARPVIAAELVRSAPSSCKSLNQSINLYSQ